MFLSNLSNNELSQIQGGGKYMLWCVLGEIGLLIIGILDGLFNPTKCNS